MSKMLVDRNWWKENDGATDIDFIRSHENLEPMGRVHKCISSADLVTKFRERAQNLGLVISTEHGAMEKSGRRYMYLAEVKDDTHEDYALTIGFRNYSDRTLAYSTIAGTQVFICSNGVCNSICAGGSMRHTFGNVDSNLVDTKINLAFEHFLADGKRIHEQIDLMHNTTLNDDIIGKFVRGMVNNPYIGAANLIRIIEDLENPERNSHKDNSVMRLMNSASHICSHIIKNPNQGAMASNFCNNLIMSIIKTDYKPLGDVIDVSSETV